jgi:hypothetical protein
VSPGAAERAERLRLREKAEVGAPIERPRPRVATGPVISPIKRFFEDEDEEDPAP